MRSGILSRLFVTCLKSAVRQLMSPLLDPHVECRHRRPAWGWLLSACLAALAVPLLAGAQGTTLYKCTTASGTLIYSDRPCAPEASAQPASGRTNPATAVVGQEIVQQRGLNPAISDVPDAAEITRRCTAPSGTPMTLKDAALETLPVRQRQSLSSTMQAMGLAGLKRADVDASSLHLGGDQTLVWCLPHRQGLRAFLFERNGRIVAMTRSGRVKVRNDANDPITLTDRCSRLVSLCFAPGQPGRSYDQCFASAAACPAGRLDPAASCCPQTCKDAYQRERANGVDPITASTNVLYGNGDPGSTCASRRDGG